MAQPQTCFTDFWEAELGYSISLAKVSLFLPDRPPCHLSGWPWAVGAGGPWPAGPQFAFIDQ